MSAISARQRRLCWLILMCQTLPPDDAFRISREEECLVRLAKARRWTKLLT